MLIDLSQGLVLHDKIFDSNQQYFTQKGGHVFFCLLHFVYVMQCMEAFSSVTFCHFVPALSFVQPIA